MKKNRKFISIISAAAILTSAMPMAVMADSKKTKITEKPVAQKIDTIFTNESYNNLIKNINTFDVNRNSKLDINDYIQIRNAINSLYMENKLNSLIASYDVTNNSSLNVDGDSDIDVNDYCCMLSFLQQNFNYSINNEEDCAIITGYKNPNATTIDIPTEIYHKGRIYPVMEIGYSAFQNMTNLKKVFIHDYIQPSWENKYNANISPSQTDYDKITACTYVYIHAYAFWNCPNLKYIELPDHTVFDNNAFAGSGLEDHYNKNDYDEVSYFTSDNDKIIACGFKNNYTSSSLISLKTGTTSINNEAFKNYSFNTVVIPSSVKYIGDGAFSGCKYLSTVIHGKNIIENVTKNDGSIILRYLSAFNGTPLVCNSTESLIAAIADDIKDDIEGYDGVSPLTAEQQHKAVNLLGQYIYTNTYYRTYGHEALFVTDPYNTLDLGRGSICSASAAFLLDTTECEGFSYASSLVLDKLGIKNYSIGGGRHALNVVYIGNRWYQLDLSADGERENQDNIPCKDRNDFLKFIKTKEFLNPIQADSSWGIAGRPEFEMFPSSKDNQLYESLIRYTAPLDSSVLILRTDISQLSDPKYQFIRDDLNRGIIKLEKSAISDNNWISDRGTLHCYDSFGNIKKNQWTRNENNELCFVDENGDLCNEWTINNDVVYHNGNTVTEGFYNEGNKKFYVNSDGSLAINVWLSFGDDMYCTDGCGNIVTDQWAYISNGNGYYLGSDGKNNSSLKIIDNKVYKYNNLLTYSFLRIDNDTYAVDGNGHLVKDQWFAPENNESYCFDKDGKCVEGVKCVNDKVYYNGNLVEERLINDKYAVNKSSEIEKNTFVVCSGNYYFTDEYGAIKKSQWIDWGNEKYYLYSDGRCENDIHIVNGIVYDKDEVYEYSTFTFDNITFHVGEGGKFLGE